MLSPRIWLVTIAIVLTAAVWRNWPAISGAAGATSLAPSSPAADADARQQEILRENIGKPGDAALEALYARINRDHFSGVLPAMPLRWESRLEEVGALAGRSFTLEGMFGRLADRTIILLHPKLQSDERALERALCHEMVHAWLYTVGDTSTNHGSEFQQVLKRLAEERAFVGLVATPEERGQLREWLDEEGARIDAERREIDRLMQDLDRERVELERVVADLDERAAAAKASGTGWPDPREAAAVAARSDAYNTRAAEANARIERHRNAVAERNRQVERYNLMVSYPDGLAEETARLSRAYR